MSQPADDPVLHSARREAIVVFITWVCAFAWTVTVCYLRGYNRKLEDVSFVLGFPDWVFWGIIVPWAACFALSYWFSYFFMTDADLGTDPDEAATAGGDGGDADHA
jgi:hypothetical protein